MNWEFFLLAGPMVIGGFLAMGAGYWLVKRERKQAEREREHATRSS